MSKDQSNFNSKTEISTPPVDQNTLVAKLEEKLSKKQGEIEALRIQLQEFSNKPNIVAKLQEKIDQKLQELNYFIDKNQKALVVAGFFVLGGAIAGQGNQINSLQVQTLRNTEFSLDRDEQMVRIIKGTDERTTEEFRTEIQELKKTVRDLKNNQSSTLLPQNNQIPTPSPEIKILPGYNNRAFQSDQEENTNNFNPNGYNLIRIPKTPENDMKPKMPESPSVSAPAPMPETTKPTLSEPTLSEPAPE